MQANIFVYDVIGEDTTLKNIRQQLDTFSSYDSILVHINSVGGDVMEGYAIHDYLRSLNVPITTKIEGKCYSIATVVALAGDERIMSANSDFMIHNPWMGEQSGDAKRFKEVSDLLDKEERRLAKFYSQKIGKPVDVIEAMMEAETYMKIDEAESLGFINKRDEKQLKAVAKLNTDIMDQKEKKEANSVLEEIRAMFKGMLKNMDEDEPKAEMDEEDKMKNVMLEDGEFELADGRRIVVTDGVAQIMAPEPEAEMDDEAEAMKRKIEDLESQLAQANAAKAENEEAMKAAQKEQEDKFTALAAKLEKLNGLVVSDEAPKEQPKPNVTDKSTPKDEGASKLSEMFAQKEKVKSFYN